MVDKYQGEGLEVLAFPCDQFGAQELPTKDIKAFCASKGYSDKIRLMDKVFVNGPNTAPVYKALKSAGCKGCESDIGWNFKRKYLVSRSGVVEASEERDPMSLEKRIQALLAE